jgi:hypothetical protein
MPVKCIPYYPNTLQGQAILAAMEGVVLNSTFVHLNKLHCLATGKCLLQLRSAQA